MRGHQVLILLIAVACGTSKNQVNNIPVLKKDTIVNKDTATVFNFTSIPKVIIYKTRNDYYNNIPVSLSDDKTKIISYPSPRDVYTNGKLAYPTRLNDGYLIDNRGIIKTVAFLSITYEEYSKLKQSPTISELMTMIIDREPLLEMYNCGSVYQYKDIVNELNNAIDNKQLNRFKKIL